MDEHRPLRTFGRIKARTLKPRQAGLMDTLLPHLAVPDEGAIDVEALFSSPAPTRGGGQGGGGRADAAAFADTSATARPPSDRFAVTSPARGEVVLEIGFGGGEHLVAQATAHPETRFIGVEPFINGVASCLRHIEDSGVQNVRLHQGDARDVIARLPDASVELCYILFPDPWPKVRHHKRRLIQPAFLDDLARVLKPGAEVRFATDWANYASWTLEHFVRDTRFAWTAERAEDWRNAWPGHVTTRYEAKKLGDCAPVWLRFARR
ncbi:tRNA (guanine-N(7)-)-methyltransferase [Terricaulis silvestris]|uniref:tRNA (guanine-N(7)-)-methyltransferase n=2 Tax=Terricaulis silvestris TaxID=2686094 RepID=A0A6I6MNZ6_9CAUL|nr:tRNA (guanosine(46)-N7)-methyltransferase TrmB [Terricaulis silvestris]QGZ97090.1 tRNA (guanine-N(7)-)-methyltransferase [Terricaulis silvestris]